MNGYEINKIKINGGNEKCLKRNLTLNALAPTKNALDAQVAKSARQTTKSVEICQLVSVLKSKT